MLGIFRVFIFRPSIVGFFSCASGLRNSYEKTEAYRSSRLARAREKTEEKKEKEKRPTKRETREKGTIQQQAWRREREPVLISYVGRNVTRGACTRGSPDVHAYSVIRHCLIHILSLETEATPDVADFFGVFFAFRGIFCYSASSILLSI